MSNSILTQLSEWNAQLFREYKGRFQPRAVILVTLMSAIAQIILVLGVSRSNCLDYEDYQCTIYDWSQQWMYAFRTLNYVIPLLLLIGGVYLLVSDLAKEERRGTLNFIRLSPQPSAKVLLGKILGVPILVYWAVGLAIPLHLWAGIGAGIPFYWIMGIYTLWGGGCACFFTLALLLTLMSDRDQRLGEQSLAGGASVLAFMGAMPFVQMVDFSRSFYQDLSRYPFSFKWFFLPIIPNAFWGYVLTLSTLGIGSYWGWQMLNRRYQNSELTTLSKSQSYLVVATSQLWLLGFFWNYQTDSETLKASMAMVTVANLFGFLILSFLLIPTRQTCLDWARYRHQQSETRNLLKDLIWGERSPATLALLLNVLLTTVLWMSWILRWESPGKLPAIFGLILCGNLILIYTVIAQLGLLMKTKKRATIAALEVAGSLILPLISLPLLSIPIAEYPGVWLFAGFGSIWLMSGYPLLSNVIFAIFGQWVILGVLTLKFTENLQKMGESTSKPLLTGL